MDASNAGRLGYPLGVPMRGASESLSVSHQGTRRMKHTVKRQENVIDMELHSAIGLGDRCCVG